MTLTTFPVKGFHWLPLVTADMIITIVACMSTGNGAHT